MLRAPAWCAAGALVVLGARWLAYALAPRPTVLTLELQRSAGGPRLIVLSLVVLGIAAVVSAAFVGAAALAVGERLALERGHVFAPPRIRPLRMLGRFAALAVTTSLAFALLESYLHWRAGLGWHGLHCLVGPVHRDALPLLAGLSLVAVAIVAAAEHLVAWMRRTIARLVARPKLVGPRVRRRSPTPVAQRRARPVCAGLPARGPPDRIEARIAALAAATI